jgi:hypothetical protein
MHNPDHISESLSTIFWVKILKFFDATRDGKIRIRDKHPESVTLLGSSTATPLHLHLCNNVICLFDEWERL